MKDDRLEFYDPLYETITFERGLPSQRGGFRLEAEDPLDPRDIVQTAEFARLAFLRQAGLAWLVFPSATHTRFAHSIGCWWLGRIAESLIRVMVDRRPSHTVSLRSWLNGNRLREEFYLALLFHDIGHGPLSHVLERNRDFVLALSNSGLDHCDHEHRGADLLLGLGPIAKMWQDKIVQTRYGENISTFLDIRKNLEAFDHKVCLPAVCYLLTSDDSYLRKCDHRHKNNLPIVKELVTGVLDLDRLDHYARDSYFSGLRQVSINVRGFLTNLKLNLPNNGSDKKPLLWVTEDGASYAASLLFSKRQILSTMFRNPRSVSYHSMINWALSAFINDLPDAQQRSEECVKIALMEDDQFIELLSCSNNEGCRCVTKRIRAMQPYSLVNKWEKAELRGDPDDIKIALENYSKKLEKNLSPSIIIHFDEGFWSSRRQKESRDWLDTDSLLIEDTGIMLTEHPEHKADFEYLRDIGKVKYMWVFVNDDAKQEKVHRDIDDIFRRKK